MINPTIGNESQFTAPFDILPNVVYTNPTYKKIGVVNTNILPNAVYTNPTYKKIGVVDTNRAISEYSGYKGNPFDTIQPGKVFLTTTVPDNTSNFRAVKDMWSAPAAQATNITLTSFAANAVGVAAGSVASLTGIPQVAQSANSLIHLSDSTLTSTYATLQLDQLKPIPGVKYADFRNRRALGNAAALTVLRLDGAAAAAAGGKTARTALFAAASANPLGGAYSLFNLNGFGYTGYGWGSQDDPYAIRNDFTLRSHIVKRWRSTKDTTDPKSWKLTSRIDEVAIPFRGDRVNVIDFSQRTETDAYKWHPNLPGQLGSTQDFIKFYFTGPKLYPGRSAAIPLFGNKSNTAADRSQTDDVIVFRASITDLSDSFTADWTPVTMIGRGDKNYQYSGFDRDLNVSFTVYATDRDELQPIWRKLNALAGYTAPRYNRDISLGSPWMRITIGDLFRQTPVLLTALSYTLHDNDTTWEINIEDAHYMMQVPHKVDVKCTFTVIGNELPQNGGKFYSLAKRWDNTGNALPGDDNWLSDMKENSAAEVERLWRNERSAGTETVTSEETTKTLNIDQNELSSRSKIQQLVGSKNQLLDAAKPKRRN